MFLFFRGKDAEYETLLSCSPFSRRRLVAQCRAAMIGLSDVPASHQVASDFCGEPMILPSSFEVAPRARRERMRRSIDTVGSPASILAS